MLPFPQFLSFEAYIWYIDLFEATFKGLELFSHPNFILPFSCEILYIKFNLKKLGHYKEPHVTAFAPYLQISAAAKQFIYSHSAWHLNYSPRLIKIFRVAHKNMLPSQPSHGWFARSHVRRLHTRNIVTLLPFLDKSALGMRKSTRWL